jgi:hypothetical protein
MKAHLGPSIHFCAEGKLMLASMRNGAACLLLAVSAAAGQSFNIDMDSTGSPSLGAGVPSPLFGAAADQPGFWTSYLPTNDAVPLVSLSSGAPTSAMVQVISSSTTLSVNGFNNAANTGDFALLFNDGAQIGTTVQGGNRTYRVSGLLDGPYAVYTYTGRPQGTEGELQVEVVGSSQGVMTASGTPVGNTFTSGVTHVIHQVNVVGGAIDLRLTDIAGAPAGYVGGIQIALVPEPAGLTALAALAGFTARRRRGLTDR